MMNNRLDRFLLGTLWLVALVLCACFWFDVRFGFNLFSGAHWRYLADAQVGPAPVTLWFYISLALFLVVGIIGLYLLLQTKRSKTAPSEPIVARPALMPPSAFAEPIAPQSEQPALVENVARPPRPGLSQPPRILSATPAAPALTLRTPEPAKNPATAVNPETRRAVHEIVQRAGYTVRRGPTINGLALDVWALGTNEVLLAGVICPVGGDITAIEGGQSQWKSSDSTKFDSPVWQLTGAVQKLQTLFMETLEDIAINVRPFVIMDGGKIVNRDRVKSIWDAFGCSVFDNVDRFADFMNGFPNPPPDPDDMGDFEAYVDYMDTVSQHFNDKQD